MYYLLNLQREGYVSNVKNIEPVHDVNWLLARDGWQHSQRGGQVQGRDLLCPPPKHNTEIKPFPKVIQF